MAMRLFLIFKYWVDHNLGVYLRWGDDHSVGFGRSVHQQHRAG
jgi:hypothetical protein